MIKYYAKSLSRFLALVCISGIDSDFSKGALFVNNILWSLLSVHLFDLRFGKSKTIIYII